MLRPFVDRLLKFLGFLPVLETEDRLLRRQIALDCVYTAGIVGLVQLVIAFFSAEITFRLILLGMTTLVLAGILWLVIRSGRINTAAVLVPIMSYCTITYTAYTAGGVNAPIYNGLSLVVIFTMFIFGVRAGIVTAVVVALTGAGFLVLEARELLPAYVPRSSFTRYLAYTSHLLMLVPFVALFYRHLHASLQQALHEVKERKRSQRQVEHQASLLDRAHDAIIVLTADGKVTYWNGGAEKLYGWPALEAVGKTMGDMLCAGNDRTVYETARTAVLTQGEWNGELPQTTRTGERVLVDSRWTLVDDTESDSRLIFTINADITEQRSLQSQLLRSQRLEGLGTLAGGIAHDFNNLLAMILGSAELLKPSLASMPRLAKYVTRIIEASERGRSISRQLLIFSRPDEAELLPITVGNVITGMEELMRHFLPKTIEIRTAVDPGTPCILGDAGQIQQALLNLVINAGDAMPKGGQLSIRTFTARPGTLWERLGVDTTVACTAIAISDTGTGIPKELHKKVFDPFFTTKEKGKGTGLGLSIVYGIMQNHRGYIDLLSTPGAGTTFTLYFPAIEATASV